MYAQCATALHQRVRPQAVDLRRAAAAARHHARSRRRGANLTKAIVPLSRLGHTRRCCYWRLGLGRPERGRRRTTSSAPSPGPRPGCARRRGRRGPTPQTPPVRRSRPQSKRIGSSKRAHPMRMPSHLTPHQLLTTNTTCNIEHLLHTCSPLQPRLPEIAQDDNPPKRANGKVKANESFSPLPAPQSNSPMSFPQVGPMPYRNVNHGSAKPKEGR